MNKNTVVAFAEFITQNQRFILYDSIHFDIPEGGISPEEYQSKGIAISVISSKKKNNHEFSSDLEQLKNKAIFYIQLTFAEHKGNAVFILTDAIQKLVEIENGFNKITFNSEEHNWHDAITLVNDSTQEKLDQSKLTAPQIEKISKILDLQKKAVSEVIHAYENATSLLTGTPSVFKLKTTLSVNELALLFRLLDTEKLFTYIHKTELFRFISSSFNTAKQDNISEASIKNKFLSPDYTALSNLDALLVNLRQNLKKIQLLLS